MENKCYLCGSNNIFIKHKGVRDNDDIDVLECRRCGLVFLSKIQKQYVEFYEESNMHSSDYTLEKWINSTKEDDLRRVKYTEKIIFNKDVLDFGSGNGEFLRLIKNRANSVTGIELEKSVKKHYSDIGIELKRSVSELDCLYDVVTMFHVLEHLPDPKKILEELKLVLKPGGIILVEVPNADDALIKLYQSKAFCDFTYWSCHLYLFNAKTIRELVSNTKLEIQSIEQIQRYPLSNHLYWLSHQKPGGHLIFKELNSIKLNEEYSKNLAEMEMCDTLMVKIY